MAAERGETVCVTGANGFIGSWLVRTLLQKGYTVRGAFQPGTATSHLLSLPGAHGRLSLSEADLLDSAAIQAAVAGSSGVFHVASPCTLYDPRDPEPELLLPAVQGTLNVLEASRSVIHCLVDCIVCNSWKKGSNDTQEYHWLGCVHVRDVAIAHVLLFETPSASGRYLCTNGIYQFKDFAKTVAKLCPGYPIHSFTEETQPGLMECKDASKRLIDLGLVFTPIEETIQDAVASLKAKGFLELAKQQ